MVERRAEAPGLLLPTDYRGPEDADHLLTFNGRGTRLAVGWDVANPVFVFAPADRMLGYATPNADWALFAAAAEGGTLVRKG